MSARFPMKGEELEHIQTIYAEIFRYVGDSDRREICGRLLGYFINMEQMFNDGENFLIYLDDHSKGLSETIQLFNSDENEKTGCLKPATQKALNLEYPFYTYDNFIYIERLEIAHKHRGKGLGMHFFNQALTYLARVLRFDFYALKPFPLQSESARKEKLNDKWQKRLDLDKLGKNFDKSLKKLCSLYADLGFEKVRGTNFMVCQSYYFRK